MSHLIAPTAHRIGKTFPWKDNNVTNDNELLLLRGIEALLKHHLTHRHLFIIRAVLSPISTNQCELKLMVMPRIKEPPFQQMFNQGFIRELIELTHDFDAYHYEQNDQIDRYFTSHLTDGFIYKKERENLVNFPWNRWLQFRMVSSGKLQSYGLIYSSNFWLNKKMLKKKYLFIKKRKNFWGKNINRYKIAKVDKNRKNLYKKLRRKLAKWLLKIRKTKNLYKKLRRKYKVRNKKLSKINRNHLKKLYIKIKIYIKLAKKIEKMGKNFPNLVYHLKKKRKKIFSQVRKTIKTRLLVKSRRLRRNLRYPKRWRYDRYSVRHINTSKIAAKLSKIFQREMTVKLFNIWAYLAKKGLARFWGLQQHLWDKAYKRFRFRYNFYFDFVNSMFLISLIKGTEAIFLQLVSTVLQYFADRKILKRYTKFIDTLIKNTYLIRRHFILFRLTITGKLAGGSKRTKIAKLGFGKLPNQSVTLDATGLTTSSTHLFGEFGLKLVLCRNLKLKTDVSRAVKVEELLQQRRKKMKKSERKKRWKKLLREISTKARWKILRPRIRRRQKFLRKQLEKKLRTWRRRYKKDKKWLPYWLKLQIKKRKELLWRLPRARVTKRILKAYKYGNLSSIKLFYNFKAQAVVKKLKVIRNEIYQQGWLDQKQRQWNYDRDFIIDAEKDDIIWLRNKILNNGLNEKFISDLDKTYPLCRTQKWRYQYDLPRENWHVTWPRFSTSKWFVKYVSPYKKLQLLKASKAAAKIGLKVKKLALKKILKRGIKIN